MFTKARLKLTAWYLVIIMSISILFSMAIYFLLNEELVRNYMGLVRRIEDRQILPPDPELRTILDPNVLIATQNRIKLRLFYTNLVILGLSATAGYFLAGRTLKPIKEMVEEENRFVSDASHELRTPLTALRTTLEVNIRDKKMNLKEAKDVLRDNLEEIEKLQLLSENLLTLSRKNSDSDLNPERIRLNTVVDDAISKIRVMAGKNKIKVETDIVDKEFVGDKDKLVRLLVILLDNAIKYSKSGNSVKILAKPIDHKIKIEVADHGIGISKEDLPHIFDRFYRADKSRSKTDGYGLGLAIAKKIVELHRGSIGATSISGKGTTFTFYIPTYHKLS